MPKQRITKEMVVNAAFEIARNDGMEQVMVKTIAEKMLFRWRRDLFTSTMSAKSCFFMK